MPSIDQQLRDFAQRLDDAVAPVQADEVVVPETVLEGAHRKRPRGRIVASAIALAAAIIITSIVVVRDHHTPRSPAGDVRATTTTAATPIAWTSGPGVDIGTSTLAVYTQSAPVVLAERGAQLPSLAGKVLVAISDARCRGIASVSRGLRTIDIRLRRATGIGCGGGGGAPSIVLQRSALPRGIVTFRVVGGPALRIDLDRPGASAVTGAAAPCVMARSSDGSGALTQPATITLPSGRTFAIRPGDPITAPNDVTLDGDGSPPGAVHDPSVVGGQAAISLLWGATTPNGPFAGLDRVAVGATFTLDQAQPRPCLQHWRVASILGPNAHGSRLPLPTLALVGFQPTNGGGPNILFYVVAVPA
jgi:hypothetical protein